MAEPSARFINLIRIVAVSVSSIFVSASLGLAEEPSGSLWRSSPGTLDSISQQIETLYISLYNTNQLDTVLYKDEDGDSIEMVLRKLHKFVGSNFPLGIDSVMCDLNPNVCTRSKSNTGKVGVNINGSTKSIGTWSNRAGDSLNVPSFTFETFVEFRPVTKKPGVKLGDLVSATDDDCRRVLAVSSCYDAIKIINRNKIGAVQDEQYSGVLVIPQLGVQARLNLRLPLPVLCNQGEPPASRKTCKEAPAPTTNPEYTGILKKIVPKGTAKLWTSSSNEEAFDKQSILFSAIHYPFANVKLSEMPPEFVTKRPVVEVLDTWLDTTHCDLIGSIELLAPEDPEPQASPTSCGTFKEHFNAVDDHATHVVGIIGAQHKSLGGIAPFTQLLFREINLTEFNSSEYRLRLQSLIVSDSNLKQVDVFNFSWGYDNDIGGNDPIESAIKASPNSLFVIAAGNEDRHFSGGACNSVPACYSKLPNVITVMGLDDDVAHPKVWKVEDLKGSDTAPEFQIGAIAQDVLSTTKANTFGIASGTSQAAPQVAAAAAFLFAQFRALHDVGESSLEPVEVKNRLTYTADIFPYLRQDVFGGRLNITRAIDTGVDQLTIDVGGVEKSLKGTLTLLDDDVVCAANDHRGKISVRSRSIKRMFFDSASQRYILFVNTPAGALERIDECRLASRSNLASFDPTEGETQAFRYLQIRDLVAAMY